MGLSRGGCVRLGIDCSLADQFNLRNKVAVKVAAALVRHNKRQMAEYMRERERESAATDTGCKLWTNTATEPMWWSVRQQTSVQLGRSIMPQSVAQPMKCTFHTRTTTC